MNDVSVEVDMLDHLPAKTLLELTAKKQLVAGFIKRFGETVRQFQPLFLEIELQDIEPRFDVTSGSIDLRFTGNGERLGEIWTMLRRAGFKPEQRPTKGEATYGAFWRHESETNAYGTDRKWAPLWISFSSTVCKRVMVGVKMVEQPVYEVQCGDLPGIEQLGEDDQSVVPV